MRGPTPAPMDLATGAIFTDAGERIHALLRRTDFERSDLGRGAAVLTRNEPWLSYLIDRAIGGRPFKVALYFEAEHLDMVLLAIDEPQFGTSWAEWSLESEMARKAAHEAWLAETVAPGLGEGRKFNWGLLQSSYDVKGGGSEIVVRYKR